MSFDDFIIQTKTAPFNPYYIAPPTYVAAGSGVVAPPRATQDDDHMLLGNPSNAVANPLMTNNYLLDSKYYVVGYSNSRGIPNWTSWHLQKSDIGSTGRTDAWAVNETLPSTFYRVTPSDYAGSSYSKGHNCPSGDRTATIAMNESVFLMTNMIPQTHKNNAGVWERLESYTRTLLNDHECYIIMGSYGSAGTIAGGKVTVPTHIWKIIVVLPIGDNDLTRINENTRVIAVITPNNTTVNDNWRDYRVTVKAIEQKTNYKLLSNIPESIRQVLINKIDNQ